METIYVIKIKELTPEFVEKLKKDFPEDTSLQIHVIENETQSIETEVESSDNQRTAEEKIEEIREKIKFRNMINDLEDPEK